MNSTVNGFPSRLIPPRSPVCERERRVCVFVWEPIQCSQAAAGEQRQQQGGATRKSRRGASDWTVTLSPTAPRSERKRRNWINRTAIRRAGFSMGKGPPFDPSSSSSSSSHELTHTEAFVWRCLGEGARILEVLGSRVQVDSIPSFEFVSYLGPTRSTMSLTVKVVCFSLPYVFGTTIINIR